MTAGAGGPPGGGTPKAGKGGGPVGAKNSASETARPTAPPAKVAVPELKKADGWRMFEEAKAIVLAAPGPQRLALFRALKEQIIKQSSFTL